MKKRIIIFILLTAALSGSAVPEGFARYQLIIEKRPFGEEPPDADIKQVPLSQSFAKNLRLSMIYEGPGGDIRVGIIDNKLKKSYTLKTGENVEGITLIEADISKDEATLQKGDEVVLFPLKAGEKPKPAPARKATRASSYAQRRAALLKKAREQKKKEQAQQPALTGEALREHLEAVQMDAIRTGKPPLPMALTPEMDAQLVSEGVLDPQ